MKLTDQRDIRAPREAVWAGITDPGTLGRCIPGCQEMTGSIEEGFDALVVQKVGPVKASFRGHVTVLDVIEGQSCTLSGEGKGGPAGFAKGEAKVTLTEIADGTRLGYEVEAKVGGKLAQLGGRIVDGVAGRMADQFFDRFKEVVEGLGPEGAERVEGGDREAEAAPGGVPATAGLSAVPAAAGLAAEAGPGPKIIPEIIPEPIPAPIGDAPAEPAAARGAAPEGADEKKGWLRRMISRDGPVET